MTRIFLILVLLLTTGCVIFINPKSDEVVPEPVCPEVVEKVAEEIQ